MIASHAVLLLKRKIAHFSTSFSGERTKRTSEKADVCIAWTTHACYKTLPSLSASSSITPYLSPLISKIYCPAGHVCGLEQQKSLSQAIMFALKFSKSRNYFPLCLEHYRKRVASRSWFFCSSLERHWKKRRIGCYVCVSARSQHYISTSLFSCQPSSIMTHYFSQYF
jgi:hypothetical protein